MRLARRLRDLLLCVLILLFVGLIAARLEPAADEIVSARFRVIDGDTLAFADKRIRLAGMDAPEIAQTCQRSDGVFRCGWAARSMLIELAGGETVTCVIAGLDRYNRSLARCRARGADLGAAMVLSGHAVAFGRYDAEEETARREKRGLWSGTFDQPRVWRETHGGMTEAPHIDGGWMKSLWQNLWN